LHELSCCVAPVLNIKRRSYEIIAAFLVTQRYENCSMHNRLGKRNAEPVEMRFLIHIAEHTRSWDSEIRHQLNIYTRNFTEQNRIEEEKVQLV
jgi:hypothetical protein